MNGKITGRQKLYKLQSITRPIELALPRKIGLCDKQIHSLVINNAYRHQRFLITRNGNPGILSNTRFVLFTYREGLRLKQRRSSN